MNAEKIVTGVKLICNSDQHEFIEKGQEVTVDNIVKKPYQGQATVKFEGKSKRSYLSNVAAYFEEL